MNRLKKKPICVLFIPMFSLFKKKKTQAPGGNAFGLSSTLLQGYCLEQDKKKELTDVGKM